MSPKKKTVRPRSTSATSVKKAPKSESAKAKPTEATSCKTGPLLGLDALNNAADCLKILAHPHRLMIVQLLLSGKPYTVGELAETCEITQPQTSDHLRLMQRCGFLSSERNGRSVYYTVAEPHLEDIMSCIESRFGSGQ